MAAQAQGTAQTSTQKEGGITYTVAQTSAWVNESTNACGGTGNGAPGTQPILALTDTVTWPDMGSTLPVVAQTDIAPPAGYYSSSLGQPGRERGGQQQPPSSAPRHHDRPRPGDPVRPAHHRRDRVRLRRLP